MARPHAALVLVLTVVTALAASGGSAAAQSLKFDRQPLDLALPRGQTAGVDGSTWTRALAAGGRLFDVTLDMAATLSGSTTRLAANRSPPMCEHSHTWSAHRVSLRWRITGRPRLAQHWSCRPLVHTSTTRLVTRSHPPGYGSLRDSDNPIPATSANELTVRDTRTPRSGGRRTTTKYRRTPGAPRRAAWGIGRGGRRMTGVGAPLT